VRPALKEEIIVPEIKEFVAPTLNSSTDFNDIISKWNNFIEQVKSEKLFFASVLLNSNPVEFNNHQLHLEVEHPEDGDIINDNKSYLDKKTKEVFGQKIEMKISKGKKSSATKKSTNANPNNNSTQADEDPIANAIINELGGREIKR
jgi:hypothetical protein